MEEEPRIDGCLAAARSRNVVVVPFFMSDGLHVVEDIPVLLGEPPAVVQERVRQGRNTWRNPAERAGRRVWYSTGIGSEALMADLVLERAREALAWTAPG
jgi:sirohydrochlorin cobaltochelatase